jgi:hypothetical protein
MEKNYNTNFNEKKIMDVWMTRFGLNFQKSTIAYIYPIVDKYRLKVKL